MGFSKALAIKGIAGIAGVVTVGVVGHNFINKNRESDENIDPKDLIERAGLNCGEESGGSSDCNAKKDGSINVKYGEDNKAEDKSFTTEGNTKLKLYRESSGYNKNLKFVVEGGDITLTGGTTTNISTKLEQFETYEIKKYEKKYYLERKTKANIGKAAALGLPNNCNLPEDGLTCSNITLSGEQLKAIKFEGKDGNGATIADGGTVTLTISKVKDTTTFVDGYKFSFQSNQDVTISGSNSIKANIKTDFKIKKNNGNLTLEKAWGLKDLAEKVGLTCSDNNSEECTAKNGSLNVKQGNKTLKNANGSSGGKIKVQKDSEGYENGFKFSIGDSSITLSGGTGNTGEITKLEEFETYEITEENGIYLLTRKTDANSLKEKKLGLPEGCKLPKDNAVGCSNVTLSEEQLKAINFEGKDAGKPSIANGGTVTLTISKDSDTKTFVDGYKFSFQSTKDITISSSNSIKENTNTEFKIKKTNDNLTLEKAWTIDKLAEKAGLNCPASGNNTECTVKNNSFQIQQSGTVVENLESFTSGKIKYHKDVGGYNQGFKFVIEEKDIKLKNNLITLEEFETYEISEGTSQNKGKYFLTRKTAALKEKGSDLGLPDKSTNALINNSQSTATFTITEQEAKKINFDGKNSDNGITISKDGTLELKIERTIDSNFPFGYKFTFTSKSEEFKINKSSGDPITLKKDSGTEFKIKKTAGKKLTLEKAWNIKEFAAKAGLTCESESSDCCTINGKINVFNEENNYITGATVSGGEQKVSLEKDATGFQEGFKFKISADIELQTTGKDTTNSKGSVDKIEAGEYEIAEKMTTIDKKWFLVKKTQGQ